MLIAYRRGQGSIILRVKILDSSVATGAGLAGLTSASSGLRISTIADNEASATAYTAGGSTIEGIATLGTFAAPTATKCRFGEVDATNHPGVYEIQLADARFAVSSARSLLVSISGATDAAETDAVIPLTDLDPYDAVRAGLTALPNAAAEASGGLITRGSSTGQLNVSSGKAPVTLASTDVSGNVAADLQTIKTQAVTCSGGVTVPAATLASTTNITAGTITTVTDLTNLPAAPTDWLTAAAVSAAAVTKVQAGLSTYAGADTAGTTTLLSRVTAAVALAGSAPSWYAAPVDVSGDVAAIKARTDNLPSDPAGLSALATAHGAGSWATATGFSTLTTGDVPTAAQNAAGLLDLAAGVEANLTVRQWLRLAAAALLGKSSGGGTVFRDINDTKDRLTGTMDASGNRTAVTRDAS